jgi:hypothetical protein
MKNERYLLSDGKRVVLCERHSQQHDNDGDLEQNLGEADKPCDDCQTALLMKNEVRAAIADVLLSHEHLCFLPSDVADELQQRLDALIDYDLLRVAIQAK